MTPAAPPPPDDPELTDEDVLDAMRHIPGYLDISVEDFREIYRLALAHARARYYPTAAGQSEQAGPEDRS